MDLSFLIILLLALFILLRVEFVFYIVYVLFGTWLAARWWAGRALSRLELQRIYADHAFLGERVPVTLRIRNRSWLPIPWLRVSETVPLILHVPNFVRRVVALPARGEAALAYTLDCRRRGYYPLGPTHLQTGDLFGFAEAQVHLSRPDHITVYPRIIPLAQLGLASQLPFGAIRTRQRLFEDPARIIGLRQYQTGDPLPRIHWKASAHSDERLVTKLDAAISLETAILLDRNAAAYDPQWIASSSEWAIVVAASIAHHLMEQRQPVGLLTNGRDPLGEPGRDARIPPRAGRPHLMKILEVLARIEVAEQTPPLPEWIHDATRDLSWGVTVIAITPNGDEATCRALHRLLRAGLNPVLIVIQPSARFAEVRQRARSLGFAAYHVAHERHLDAWRAPAPHVPIT